MMTNILSNTSLILENESLFNSSFFLGILIGVFLSIIIWALINYLILPENNEKIERKNSPYNSNNNEFNLRGEKHSGVQQNIIESFKKRNQDLNYENVNLRKEISQLKEELHKNYDQIQSLSLQVDHSRKLYPESDINTVEEMKLKDNGDDYYKIRVSLSFEDKKGTVKADELGEMFLERSNGNQFELKTEKEIYGTAIHLEQVQFNFVITNPAKANNKPMRVLKRPIYEFDNTLNKGYLIRKGEVEYQ